MSASVLCILFIFLRISFSNLHISCHSFFFLDILGIRPVLSKSDVRTFDLVSSHPNETQFSLFTAEQIQFYEFYKLRLLQ